MVEQNPTDDAKGTSSKVQIPEAAEENKAVQLSATAASTVDVNDPSDEEDKNGEETKSVPAVARKVVDQSKSNIPISTPD